MQKTTILITSLALIILCLILASCGEEKKVESPKQELLKSYVDIIKKDQFVIQFKSQEKIEDKLVDAVVTIAHKSKKEMVSVLSGDLDMKIVVKDKKVYNVIHSTEMVMVLANKEDDINDYDLETIFKEINIKEHFVGSGSEQIKGKEYFYEEYKNNDEKQSLIRFYFEGDSLKYIKKFGSDPKDDNILEILEFSSLVPDSLFDIPSGYQLKGI